MTPLSHDQPNWAEAVRGAIRKSLHRNSEEDRDIGELYFITSDDLESAWKQTRGYETVFATLSLSSEARNKIFSECLRVVSILVWIRWRHWSDLTRLMGLSWSRVPEDQPEVQFKDCYLPFSVSELKDKIFPSEPLLDYRLLFRTQQFAFCPIAIKQDHHAEIEDWHTRLPFVFESNPNNTGAYGSVTQVIVAKKHFLFRNREPNFKEVKLARKRFDMIANYAHEIRNLSMLRSNELKHDRVMICLGSFQIKQECSILFDWADGDLKQFLAGDYPPGTEKRQITPQSLLREAAGLAGALRFLHTGVSKDGKAIYLCHMDLKPNNILVMNDPDSPCGKWMITDFGISNTEPRNHGISTSRELFAKTARTPFDESAGFGLSRCPGPFQPPEAEAAVLQARNNSRKPSPGHKSDIWSFGAVILTVLVFSIGGPAHVKYLEDTLYEGSEYDEDEVYRAGYFYRKINNRFYINEMVSSWMDYLSLHEKEWFGLVWNLVLSDMMVEEPTDRSKAAHVSTRLYRICDQAPSWNVWDDHPLILENRQRRGTRDSLTGQPAGAPVTQSLGEGPSWQGRETRIVAMPPDSAPTTLSTSNTSSQSHSHIIAVRRINNGAFSDLANHLHNERNVRLAVDGARVAFWNANYATIFSGHSQPDYLFSTDFVRKIPDQNSIAWDDVRLAGEFVTLRKKPDSANVNGIFELRHLGRCPTQLLRDWTQIVDPRGVVEFDLSRSGSLAFLFQRSVKVFTCEGCPQLDYNYDGTENFMTVCFDATGRTVAAILWRRWIVWRLPDESAEFQHINSGMHSLAPVEFGNFRPQAMICTNSTRVLLHDKEAPGHFVFAWGDSKTLLEPFFLYPPLAMATSTDGQRLVTITKRRKPTAMKIFLKTRYWLHCYDISDKTRGFLADRPDLDRELNLEVGDHLQISMAVVQGDEGLVAVIALSNGWVESFPLP